MRPIRIRLRSLLILIAVAAVLLAAAAMALRSPGRPHSTVFAEFDPAALIETRPGRTVLRRNLVGGGVFNKVRGYAMKDWRGVVTAPNDPAIRQSIQILIETYLKEATGGRFHTEGTLADDPNEWPPKPGLPSHALFMFNEREWHGDMHVWLFPDSSGTSVGYAIYLREERIK